MANLDIDKDLLARAVKVGGHRTMKATVTEALEEYIIRREQARIIDSFGTIEYDADHDYKAQRNRR